MSAISNPLNGHNDIIHSVMSYLKPKDLGRCAQVCKLWLRLSEDKSLWKQLWLNISEVSLLENEELSKWTIIKHIKHSAVSFEEVMAKVVKFAETVPLHENARFIAKFPLIGGAEITLDIRPYNIPEGQEIKNQDHCCLIKDLKTSVDDLEHFRRDLLNCMYHVFNKKNEPKPRTYIDATCVIPNVVMSSSSATVYPTATENSSRRIIVISSAVSLAAIAAYFLLKKRN